MEYESQSYFKRMKKEEEIEQKKPENPDPNLYLTTTIQTHLNECKKEEI